MRLRLRSRLPRRHRDDLDVIGTHHGLGRRYRRSVIGFEEKLDVQALRRVLEPLETGDEVSDDLGLPERWDQHGIRGE